VRLCATSDAWYPPLELDVDDAGVAELIPAAWLGHGAEGRAAQVEVVLGHRVVVHVGDDHRLRVAGARIVVGASYLKMGIAATRMDF
jgi:hypothetical protein